MKYSEAKKEVKTKQANVIALNKAIRRYGQKPIPVGGIIDPTAIYIDPFLIMKLFLPENAKNRIRG